MADEQLDRELRTVAGLEGWSVGEKEKLIKEVAEVVWRECTGEDIEVPGAKVASNASVMPMAALPEEDGSFDVAKKWVDTTECAIVLTGISRLVGDAVPTQAASSHKSKKQQAVAAAVAATKAAADAVVSADMIVISIPSFPEKEIQLGPVRHRLLEPLFVGRTPGGESVWEGMGRAVESVNITSAERIAIWEGVGVVGEVARIKCTSCLPQIK